MPIEPHAAVLMGVVHYGYDPAMIRSRMTRYTYGTESSPRFRAGTDPVSKRIEDPDGKSLCIGRFAIFVSNGDTVETADRVSRTFVPVYPDQDSLQFTFYRADLPGVRGRTQSEAIGKLNIDLGDAMQLPWTSARSR